MPNYFDYILESSQEDIDDIDSIYNETDLAIAEFDTYVQEGVGMKIAIGLGIAALLGALIAVIIKVFGNRSGNSSGNKTDRAIKTALTFIQRCERVGIKTITIEGKHLNLDKVLNMMNYLEETSITRIIKLVSDLSDDCEYFIKSKNEKTQVKILSDMCESLVKINKLLDDNYGKTISDVKDLFVKTETIEIYRITHSIQILRNGKKDILKATKEMNQHRENIKKNNTEVPKQFIDQFEKISTKISSILLDLDNNIYNTFKMIIESCTKALKEKGQYKDGESLSFEDPNYSGIVITGMGHKDPTYVYEPKHYDNTLDEMKISDEEGD